MKSYGEEVGTVRYVSGVVRRTSKAEHAVVGSHINYAVLYMGTTGESSGKCYICHFLFASKK